MALLAELLVLGVMSVPAESVGELSLCSPGADVWL